MSISQLKNELNKIQTLTLVITTKKWFTATFLKQLRGGQELQPPRLMVSINQGGYFLLTDAVKKIVSQNRLDKAGSHKMTEMVILNQTPRLID